MTATKVPLDVASRRRILPPGTRFSTFRLTRNAIGGIVLLMALAGWSIGYRATQQMAESAELAALSQDAIVALRGVAVSLSRAAAAVRGAQEDRARLVDYQTEAAAYRKEMATLRGLMRNEAGQLARLDALDRIVTPHLELLDAASAGAAPLPANEPPADSVAAEIGDLLGRLEAREQALAEDRARDARARAQSAHLVQTFNALLAILTLFGAFLLFNHDVTRQQRDDARLREALKDADAANEAKTHFLASVSHEIRTPLNAVSGMSDLLLDTRLDPEQTEFARTVHNNAEALSALIGDLLDSSRIEAGQMVIDPAPFDLRELVEGVAELLVVRADAKGVEIVVDLPPVTPRRLVGDRARLWQVLMNLVGNAVKFTERGEVTIRVRARPAAEGAVGLRLVVSDTGIGIPLEAQARIFERFVQAEPSTARRYGGTGLGLAISRSLIELMGGQLSVQSEPGRGSTFEASLTLPLAPAQPPVDVESASLVGVEVLLVQQNDALRGIHESVLRFAGASVRAVGTAAEALAEIAALAPRVITVGERLPDANAIDLAKRISHERQGTSAISVVLMCSLRAMAARHIGSYGITACIYKPVRQARLIQAVGQAAGLEPVPVDRESDAAPTLAPAPTIRPRVLLVDDNQDDLVRATHILSENGYDVDRAGNGLEAVSGALACDYDLILMDVELPQVDGLEATRRIRGHEAESGRRVPIVALTAGATNDLRQETLAAGMSDCLTRPLERQQLLDTCARWIDRRPLLLIADDTADNQLLLSNYLRSSHYRLAAVANGKEAVEAVERQRPSVVLLDMNMPVMDGYEAARAIRRLPGGEAVPIVALTSYDGPQERQRCLAAGCTDFLSKPVRRGDLLARVISLVGRPDFATPPPPPAPFELTHDVRACDALAHLATLTLGVPAATVTLMIGDRVRIAGAAGVPAALDLSQGLPRGRSFTHLVVDARQSLLVEDARRDPRLDSALPVSTHGVVAVAGAPVRDRQGAVVGALCAMDTRPHRWPPAEVAMLEDLAALASRLLDPEPPPAAAETPAHANGDLVVDDDIADLVPGYVAARRQDMATLREYLEHHDLDAIARLAHKMKGSGAGYGLPEVTRLGGDIEAAARSGDSGPIGSLIDDLSGHLTRLRIRSADGRVSTEL